MADHYFTQKPSSKREEAELSFAYRGRALRFIAGAGTFSRGRVDPGSALLLEAIDSLDGRCADIGCGWGAIGLSLAAAFPDAQLLLADVNERAVELAARNARLNGIGNARALVSDGLSAVEGPLDHAVTNPPVRAGKAVVHRFFAQAYDKLSPGGTLTVVLRKQQGAPSAKAYLEQLFGNCETIARGGGYHVMRSVKGRE